MDEKPMENGVRTDRDGKGRFIVGNPGGPGRVPGTFSLITILKERLQLLGPDQKRTIAEHLGDNVLQDALEGKNTPLKLVFNYVEGLPAQSVRIAGDPQSPLEIKVINYGQHSPVPHDNPSASVPSEMVSDRDSEKSGEEQGGGDASQGRKEQNSS